MAARSTTRGVLLEGVAGTALAGSREDAEVEGHHEPVLLIPVSAPLDLKVFASLGA